MKKLVQRLDIFLAIIVFLLYSLVLFGNYFMPDSIVCYDRENTVFSNIYSCNTQSKSKSVDYQTANVMSKELKLFGVVPVKNVTVTQKQTDVVYVSGEPFGIKLYTNGVIVVGTQNVDLGDKYVNPSKDAGIEVGDIIISINNTAVFTSDEVQDVLNNNNGKPYTLKIKRDDRYKTFTLTPVYCQREGCYKAGMWVRDSTAGVGTLTFFNKNKGTFAALGHQINDVDTNEIMPMLEGEAVKANVTKIYKASSGKTGSVCCDFSTQTIGILSENTQCGVYGSYSMVTENSKEYTVASKQEVEKGNAQILTTIDGNKPKLYDIEITKIIYSDKYNQKNMVIKVTDKALLSKTGGIVQGMSGSPIIQNGKFVGAITHVIVNDPEKGYAIFAETMVNQSNNV